MGSRIRPFRELQRGLAAILLGLVASLIVFGVATAQSKPDFPALTGRVVDEARLITPGTEAALTETLARLEAETSDQVVVVTVNSLQGYEIEDYGYQLGRAWGIGQKDKDNGILLIVAPNERKVRIETGYGLEGIMTDALSAVIIHDRILPAFRVGGFERGITEGVSAIETQLRLDPEEARARAAGAEAPKPEKPVAVGAVIGLIFLFLFFALIGAASGGGRRRGVAGDMAPVLLWIAAEALKGGRGGGGGWG
ncbi:methanol dehydrogenase, partial [Rhizobium sp. CRIBSB]|nr:methanol dehydrogenase [Rhizobium sp. CRIBSB]